MTSIKKITNKMFKIRMRRWSSSYKLMAIKIKAASTPWIALTHLFAIESVLFSDSVLYFVYFFFFFFWWIEFICAYIWYCYGNKIRGKKHCLSVWCAFFGRQINDREKKQHTIDVLVIWSLHFLYIFIQLRLGENKTFEKRNRSTKNKKTHITATKAVAKTTKYNIIYKDLSSQT